MTDIGKNTNPVGSPRILSAYENGVDVLREMRQLFIQMNFAGRKLTDA